MFACRYTAARRKKPDVLAAIKTIALHNSDLGVFAAVIPFTHYALGTCIVPGNGGGPLPEGRGLK
jgi:hypothetical protein